MFYTYLEEEPAAGSILHCYFSLFSSTPLASHCLNLPFGTQGGSGRLKPSSFLKETRDLLWGFYARDGGPGPCLVSLSVIAVLFILLLCHPRGFGKKVLVAQSCPTLCNPMDCSSPGSSVHGILLERILESVAISSSKGILTTQ